MEPNNTSSTPRPDLDQPATSNRPEAPQSEAGSKSSKQVIIYAIIAIVVVLAVGATVWYTNFSQGRATEAEFYASLDGNDNPEDYKSFLDLYPDSEYAPEVKQKLKELEQMLREWSLISLSDKAADFARFKERYSTYSNYARLCDIKIDSLDFITAQRIGTPEAYQHYLSVHPEGDYASEASIAQGQIQDQEVTMEDRDRILSVINELYKGFEANDKEAICSNISATMSQFLGRQNVTKAQVLEMIENMFTENIHSVRFSVSRDAEITHESGEGNRADHVYKVKFSVDQYIEREGDGKTFSSYECEALVNSSLLITSLHMKELSRK